MRYVATALMAATLGGATIAAAGDNDPPRQKPKPQLVDGKNVRWWAKRARANGDGMRWQRKRVARLERDRDTLRRANRAEVELGAHGVVSGFLCIHTHEAGSWETNTGNGYYGGLQMDRTFQSTYGPEFYASLGTADRWPPFVQIAVAMRAYYSGRGFGPWPNTRRACGI